MIRLATAASLSLALTVPLAAQEAAQGADALFDLMGLPEIVAVMREEGMTHGEDIGIDLFGGSPTGAWMQQLEVIYDAARMEDTLRSDFTAALEGVELDSIQAFYASETGQQVVSLEVAARRALLDPEVEEASREAAVVAMTEGEPRVAQVERFIDANDLVEANVVGAMNSNYAFYMGLMDGGAMPGQMTEEQVLSDVWSQEPEIRQSSTEWLYSFLLMAYAPLDDAQMEAYIAFSESEPGQELNQALFDAFDRMFVDISRALGLAAAEAMTVQEL